MSGAHKLPISPDLTPREAARRLGTSQATIWQMISDGRLPSYSLSPKRGAARRIRWEAIEAIRCGDDPVKAVRDADLVLRKEGDN